MSLYNFVRINLVCPNCGHEGSIDFQCGACASGERTPRNIALYEIVYQIGDVMDWFDNPAYSDGWPSEYAYIFNPGSSLYVIEDCRGACDKCNEMLRAWILIVDRKLIRIIGIESAKLTTISVVSSPPSDHNGPT